MYKFTSGISLNDLLRSVETCVLLQLPGWHDSIVVCTVRNNQGAISYTARGDGKYSIKNV